MRNVLLTGGAGFIGSHVADLLVERGCEVTILDNLSTGKREHVPSGIRFVEADITDRQAVFDSFAAGFDTVVHLAAIHFIPYCNRHPDRTCRTNIEGTQNILDAAQAAHGVQRVFVASTAAVYPDCPGPIDERTARAPMDVYGMTKSANEEQVAILARRSDIAVSVGRFFNAVGARETNPHLVPDVLERIRHSNTIEIGNTSPKRDYIDVRDMASGVLAMLEGNRPGISTCNIGTGDVYDVVQIADMLSAIHGSKITLAPAERLIRKVERQNLQADSRLLQATYGWSPRFGIRDSLAYAHAWYAGR